MCHFWRYWIFLTLLRTFGVMFLTLWRLPRDTLIVFFLIQTLIKHIWRILLISNHLHFDGQDKSGPRALIRHKPLIWLEKLKNTPSANEWVLNNVQKCLNISWTNLQNIQWRLGPSSHKVSWLLLHCSVGGPPKKANPLGFSPPPKKKPASGPRVRPLHCAVSGLLLTPLKTFSLFFSPLKTFHCFFLSKMLIM